MASLQEKNIQLERSLSAETRLKLDLFSALGDAKRQVEIHQGQNLLVDRFHLYLYVKLMVNLDRIKVLQRPHWKCLKYFRSSHAKGPWTVRFEKPHWRGHGFHAWNFNLLGKNQLSFAFILITEPHSQLSSPPGSARSAEQTAEPPAGGGRRSLLTPPKLPVHSVFEHRTSPMTAGAAGTSRTSQNNRFSLGKLILF